MKMHQFLKEEEQLQLQLLEREEKANMKKLRENEIQLTQQIRRLGKMIGRIESTCQNLTLESFEVRQNSRGHWGKIFFFIKFFLLRIFLNYISNAIPKVLHTLTPLPYLPTPTFWPWRSPVLGHIKFACPMGLSFQ
jgi:hypothetical protein